MPLNDYNTSAALNTTLGTIPVGPGMARKKVNDAIQQLMADLAALPTYNVTPTGEGVSSPLRTALWTSTNGPRIAVKVVGPFTVQIHARDVVMGGFRHMGRNQYAKGPKFSFADYRTSAASPGDIDGLTVSTKDNHYAVFAVANDGDANCVLKLVPILMVKSVSGSVVTLGMCGEDINCRRIDGSGGRTAASYDWSSNYLAGVECLVITEQGGGNSGRVTTFTANTGTTVTLASIGLVARDDMLVPKPKGYDYTQYLGSCYLETSVTYPAEGELRNMCDDGYIIRNRMAIDVSNYNGGATYLDGSIAQGSAKVIKLMGFISPLAGGVYFNEECTLAGASNGDAYTFFDIDGGAHISDAHHMKKFAGTSEVFTDKSTLLTFNAGQQYFVWTQGAIAVNRTSCNHRVTGWVEL